MNKKTLPVYIAAAIILLVGIWIVAKASNKDDGNEVANTNTTNSVAQPEPVNANATANANANTAPTPSDAACTRRFSDALLKNTKYSMNNKFVTLQIKDYGTIKIEMYPQDAPKTVQNFVQLAQSGFYDCLTFHRIAKGFVAQGGDPSGTGSGGSSIYGKEFEDELNPNTPSYKAGYQKGVVAMANRGPNTNTSQFFIMLGDNQLPHAYTIFGKVIEGQSVVDKIGQAPITPQMGPTDGAPTEKIVIEKAIVSDK
ncbi:MAG: peptidylprolyl isomerase [bacterium]|nr:peptidylprolyl isomerase [bacterium]